MKLDKLEIVLAKRTPWQAKDLGIKVTLQHIRMLFAISFFTTFTLSAVLLLVLQDAVWVMLALFWFKPVIERPLLYYISRAIFGDCPSFSQVIKSWPSWASRQALWTFTIRRLSPSRSFNDSVVMLEGLAGSQRNQRVKVLHSNNNTGSFMLTILGIHIEIILEWSLYASLIYLLPIDIEGFSLASLVFSESNLALYSQLLCYAIAVGLVAPFYVCCGFVLYLNQRTILEAWDIELGFKKLVKRLSQASVSILFMSIGMLMLPSKQVVANNNSNLDSSIQIASVAVDLKQNHDEHFPLSNSQQATEIRAELNTLFESDLFGEHYRQAQWPDKVDESVEPIDLEFLRRVATFFKIIFICLLAALLGFVLYRYQPWTWLNLDRTTSTKPSTVLGMNVKRNSLPKNVLSKIQKSIDENNWREAMSLMFRTHIMLAIERHNIPFKSSSTELDCVRLIREHTSKLEADCFAQLMSLWQLLAYAHRKPDTVALQTNYKSWLAVIKRYLEA